MEILRRRSSAVVVLIAPLLLFYGYSNVLDMRVTSLGDNSVSSKQEAAAVANDDITEDDNITETIEDDACQDRSDLQFGHEASKDCGWVAGREGRCKHTWFKKTIKHYWCPETCNGCDGDDTNSTSEETNQQFQNNTIVYLTHPGQPEKGLKFGGVAGDCPCGLKRINARANELNELDWSTVGSVIMSSNKADKDRQLVDLIPPHVFKILQWREAHFATPPQEIQAKFDVIMGTHFKDGILNPCHYPSRFTGGFERNPFKKRTRMVAWISSHCHTRSGGREKFVKTLQKYMDVEIFGKCADKDYNISFPDKEHRNEEMKFYSNFKFYIAAENDMTKGYVSEKLFVGLGSGAVPVYFGASEINEFPKLDGRTDWFINARDFPTVESLANFLKDMNETEWRKYLRWQSYSRKGGEYMPNAPRSFKECFETKNIRGFSAGQKHRHVFVCKLCNPEYIEEVRNRTFVPVGDNNPISNEEEIYPPAWEDEYRI